MRVKSGGRMRRDVTQGGVMVRWWKIGVGCKGSSVFWRVVRLGLLLVCVGFLRRQVARPVVGARGLSQEAAWLGLLMCVCVCVGRWPWFAVPRPLVRRSGLLPGGDSQWVSVADSAAGGTDIERRRGAWGSLGGGPCPARSVPWAVVAELCPGQWSGHSVVARTQGGGE